MFNIRIADIVVEIDNRFAYSHEYCKGWECGGVPDIRVRVTHDELSEYISTCGYSVREDVAERILMCRAVARELPRYNAFLLHGGVIEYEGHGIIFSARRGVGKTTHMRLWQDTFGDSVKIINGDKPVILREGNTSLAYGTPWCGKEGYGSHGHVAVDKLCFIERAQTPSVRALSPEEGWERVKSQIIYPVDFSLNGTFAQSVADMLRSVDIYEIGVNMQSESALYVKNKILTV